MQNVVGLDDGLAPDQRQVITQRDCVIYTFSGYKYTLISEWTRLFGLLRILYNLISVAVCYFCTTIYVFCEIYTLRMRVVAHAAIVWVGCFFMPSSGVGLVYLSPWVVITIAVVSRCNLLLNRQHVEDQVDQTSQMNTSVLTWTVFKGILDDTMQFTIFRERHLWTNWQIHNVMTRAKEFSIVDRL